MSAFDPTILDQPRFRQPEGWRWHSFRNKRGMKIRFGSVFPKDKIPHAIVVALPGLSEFGEKYFELAHDMLARNLAFWVIDWAGQGMSDRYIKGSQKRHSTSYNDDLDDLHQWIGDYIKPASVHPDVGRIARVMLGHSMGAHLGIRHMQAHPDSVLAAAFSAPLINIKAVETLPSFMAAGLSYALTPVHKKYIDAHRGDWDGKDRANPGNDIFSSDPVRDQVHHLWQMKNPELQVGHATFGWVHESLKSCRALCKPSALARLKTPMLVGMAGADSLVSNRAIRKVLGARDHVTLLDLPGARHEIFMEQDGMRGLFLAGFDDLLTKHVLSCTDRVKPF